MRNNKLTLPEKIKAYHMMPNFVISCFLIITNILSLVLYVIFPAIRNSEIWSNVFIAVITGLVATILGTVSEIYIEFKNNERGALLEDIYSFGIEGLSLEKGEVLKEELKRCRRLIWISGYRLILTERIKDNFAEAVKRGADVEIVVCPPWLDGFKLVYGTGEKIIDNYYQVFHAIREASREKGNVVRVYFTEKPLFSDTYRIDNEIITGPYLHNRDEEFNRIMAKDFFTYIVASDSPLYKLIENEFLTTRDESVEVLSWIKFDEIWEKYSLHTEEATENEKIDWMKSAVDKNNSRISGN